MGHTTAVAGNAASRQKNCNACVQAKRRCNRRAPVCSRCVEKKVACIYEKTRAAVSSQPGNENFEVEPYMESLDFAHSFSPGLSLDPDFLGAMPTDFQTGTATAEPLPSSVMDATRSGDAHIDPLMWLFDGDMTVDKDQWLISSDPEPTTDRPNSPAAGGTLLAYQKMSKFCVSPVQQSSLQ